MCSPREISAHAVCSAYCAHFTWKILITKRTIQAICCVHVPNRIISGVYVCMHIFVATHVNSHTPHKRKTQYGQGLHKYKWVTACVKLLKELECIWGVCHEPQEPFTASIRKHARCIRMALMTLDTLPHMQHLCFNSFFSAFPPFPLSFLL